MIQDEVTDAIVAAIAPEIDEVERDRAQRKLPGSLDAWSLFQRALGSYYASTEESLEYAIEAFDAVNQLDPRFAPAFAMAADARVRFVLHYRVDNNSLLTEALEKARLGIMLDARDSTCLWAEGRAHSMIGNHDAAIAKGQEALDLNPSSAMAHYVLGFILGSAGHPEDAIPHVERAMRLSPRDIFSAGFLGFGSEMLFHVGRYQEALKWARRARHTQNPPQESAFVIMAVLIKLSRLEEAAVALDDLLTHAPTSSLSELQNRFNRNFPESAEANRRFIDALCEAGLPE